MEVILGLLVFGIIMVLVGFVSFVVGGAYVMYRAKQGVYRDYGIVPADWYHHLRVAFLTWRDDESPQNAMALARALVAHRMSPDTALAPDPEVPMAPAHSETVDEVVAWTADRRGPTP